MHMNSFIWLTLYQNNINKSFIKFSISNKYKLLFINIKRSACQVWNVIISKKYTTRWILTFNHFGQEVIKTLNALSFLLE